MKKIVIYIFVLAVSWLFYVFVMGFDIDVGLIKNNKEISITFYNDNNSSEIERLLTNDEKDELIRWLQSNDSDWTDSLVSYVPDIVLRGENFSLNFLPDLAVLNYKSESMEKYVQVTRTLKNDENILSFLGQNE